MTGLTTVKGAVFALIGLLLHSRFAGPFNGSMTADNWSSRRQTLPARPMIVSPYLKVISLAPYRLNLNTICKRVSIYIACRMISRCGSKRNSSRRSSRTRSSLKNRLWDAAVAACPQAGFRPACAQSLPSLASLFEVARMRVGASEKHPPHIMYVMLFGLGLGGSLLAGFGMAAAKSRSWIHMLIFATP